MQQTILEYDDKCRQRDRILTLLKRNEFVSTAELRLIAYQYNARIYELRALGYVINSTHINGKYGFMLLGRRK